ncbi:MAG: hypothetical protein GWP19_00805 [Planctomycetia bacterium]|nr:hypothetical protein [Planctomycetia bacterium]
MHTFEYLKYKRHYAAMWNELTDEQLLFVSHLFDQGLEFEAFNTLVLQNFTQIPWKYFFEISPEAIISLSGTIDFLHKGTELTINLLPKLKINKKTLNGPANAMMDVTFEQFFGHTEPAFTAFAQNNDMDMLNHLIAALYSFENEIFNADLIEGNKRLISSGLRRNYKTSIVFFYLGCRDLMAGRFPKLFSNKKTTTKANDLAYFEMLENLNNENISNNEIIKKSNIYEAFVRLTAMIEKSEKLKKNNK